MKHKLLFILLLFFYKISAQTPLGFLDFANTANGTTATTGNTGFGGVRIGSGGGSFTIQNPGQSIGSLGELRGIAPSTASINSIGITSTEFPNASAATTFTTSFEVHLSGGSSGIWYFFAGNGTSFGSAQSTGFTGADVFTGIRWTFGAGNTITTDNRAAGAWSTVSGTPFAQNTSYYVTIVGNNSASTVNYGASNAFSVLSNTYDLWVNGVLVGDNLAKGQLGATTAINAFRFYGESSTGNVAQIALDNVRWYNTCVLPPTHLTLVSVPAAGTTSSNITSYTCEARSGSSTGPVANLFTGAITVGQVSGPGAISGTLAPNAISGVATYSNTQFDTAGTYTINATAASPIVTAATSGNIVITSATGYYWNGGTIASSPANGGTGTWSAANAWRQPGASGAQSNWTDANPAVIAGTAGTITLSGNATPTSTTFNTTGYTLATSGASGITLGGTVDFSTNALTISPISGANLTISGAISGSGASGNTILTKSGTGNLLLSSGNSFTGKILINNGFIGASGESRFGANPGSFTADQITLNGGGILSSGGAINFSSNRGLTLGASGGTFDTTGGTITLTNIVAGNANGALTKIGTGTLIMNGAHTFNGATNINAGTLQLGINSSLPSTTAVTAISNAVFDVNGKTQTIGSLSSGGVTTSSVTLGAGSLTVGDTNSTSFLGAITGSTAAASTAITKQGSGTLTLSNTLNTYSGKTVVNAGFIASSGEACFGASPGAFTADQVTFNGGGFQATGGVNFNSNRGITLGASGGTFDTNGNTITLTNVVTGSGGLTKIGTGTLALNGNHTYTGTTTITAGTLQYNVANALSNSSNITLNGGTFSTGATAGFSDTVGTLNLNTNSTIALGTGAHTLTFANSNGVSWAGSTLNITGWTGIAGASGIEGQIFVGVGGLTAAQLAKITFSSYPGTPIILGTGELVPPAATNLSVSTLTGFGSVCTNSTAGPNSFTITGTGLTSANVTVTTLSGYTYSTTAGGSYASTLSLTQSGGAYSQTIFVKFTPNAVSAFNGNIVVGGGGASNVNVAATGSGIDTAATISSPTSASIATTSVTLGGNITSIGCTSATEIGIYYSTSTGFADGTGTKVSTTGTFGTGVFTQAVTGLTPNTVYFYKAFATNSGGSVYTTQGTFTTLHNAPTVGSCSGATTTTLSTNWTAPAGGGSATYTFEVQVDDDSNCGSVNYTANSISSATLTDAASGLTAGTTYYYRVRAVNAGGNSAWSSTSGGCTTQSGPCLTGDMSSITGWTNTGTTSDSVSGHYGSASPCRALGLNTSIVTPATNNPAQLQFFQDASSGGNGSSATVDYQIGSGGFINFYNFNVTSAGKTEVVDLTTVGGNLSLQTNVTFRFTSTFNTWYLDDVAVTCAASCTAPSSQASSFTSSALTPTTATIGWTRGNGNNVLVIVKQGSAVTTDPTNGNSYTANLNYASGGQVGIGEYVLVNGSVNTANITGLTSNTTYHFAVYEYTSSTNCYNATQLTGNFTTPSCTATTISSVTPTSGPPNTEVTITATSGTLVGATAKFNGTVATVVSSSATQLVVLVPSAGTTGNLIVTNASLCPVTATSFTVIKSVATACQGGTRPTDVFISEVTDETFGALTYVEIFNGTANPIDLSGYTLELYNNGGSTPGCSTSLATTINPSEVKVFSIGSNTDVTGITPVQYYSSCAGVNDNDNIRLRNDNTGLYIDQWGYKTNTKLTGVGSQGYSYSRKTTVTRPSTTFLESDWNITDAADSAGFGLGGQYTDVGIYPPIDGDIPTITVQPTFSPGCVTTASLTSTHAEGFNGAGDTKELNYKWFVCAPGSTSWTLLTNTGVYTGATAATLNISSLVGLNNYQYYCQIRENDDSCYIATNAVKITQAVSVWASGAWTPVGAPDINTVVSLQGNYNTSTNGNLLAKCLTVESNFTLNISDTNYVKIQSDLTVKSNASVNVSNQGNLIMVDDTGVVTNSGTMNMNKTTSSFEKYDYTYWSSPMTACTIGSALSSWRQDYTFKFVTSNYADLNNDTFDDNQDAWQRVTQSEVMTPGRGYIAMGSTTGTFPKTGNITYSGTVNNGIINYPIELSADNSRNDDDFNLIGNPYPSAIDAAAFINANKASTGTLNKTISGTIYLWTHIKDISINNPGPDLKNFKSDDYASFNLLGGTSSASGETPFVGFIGSAQAFLIEATAAGNVTFNNSMRGENILNTRFYRTNVDYLAPVEKKLEITVDRFWMSMENSLGMYSQQLLGYHPDSTLDFDYGFDGNRGNAKTYVHFYSLLNGQELKIQSRGIFNSNDTIKLGYVCNYPDEYKIKINQLDGIFKDANQSIYIQDTYLKTTHNLKDSDYTFKAEKGTFNDRFILKFLDRSQFTKTEPIEASEVVGVVVSKVENVITLKSKGAKIRNIQVFNIFGKSVFESDDLLQDEVLINSLLKDNQPLLLKITLEDGEVVTKKIIF